MIESLISLFFISILITYLSKNILVNFEVEKKFRIEQMIENDKKNLIEYVKSVKDIDKFRVDKKYFKYIDTSILKITKTNMYILFNADDKRYIYKIEVGDIYDYYIPK
ncbi:hypothetical protein [Oceanivirga miroungae]|uniref:hypothetical protein n=1 Tax=Oceanivirga miroungae TaxID=1130046 RepID=UPI0012E7A019|nr:hypothetical protein [Oceanivirga miroungae]